MNLFIVLIFYKEKVIFRMGSYRSVLLNNDLLVSGRMVFERNGNYVATTV